MKVYRVGVNSYYEGWNSEYFRTKAGALKDAKATARGMMPDEAGGEPLLDAEVIVEIIEIEKGKTGLVRALTLSSGDSLTGERIFHWIGED